MRTESSLSKLRTVFQEQLNLAITQGQAPAPESDLGPATTAAIDRVAREHPDAEADDIAAAYDAFLLDHGCDE